MDSRYLGCKWRGLCIKNGNLSVYCLLRFERNQNPIFFDVVCGEVLKYFHIYQQRNDFKIYGLLNTQDVSDRFTDQSYEICSLQKHL